MNTNMNMNMNMDVIPNASLGLAAILLAAAVFTPKPANAADYKPFTGEKTTWHEGFDRYDFIMDDATGAITPMTAPAGEVTGFGVDTAVNDGKRRCGMTSLYWRLAALRILCCG